MKHYSMANFLMKLYLLSNSTTFIRFLFKTLKILIKKNMKYRKTLHVILKLN